MSIIKINLIFVKRIKLNFDFFYILIVIFPAKFDKNDVFNIILRHNINNKSFYAEIKNYLFSKTINITVQHDRFKIVKIFIQ